MDENFIFSDEENSSGESDDRQWNILVIDDDMSVHTTTILALKNVRIHNRKLNLIHAYSSIDGIAYLRQLMNIDLILLDMVMETHDAGLNVTRWLREDSDREVTPSVILRTGHPGMLTTNDILTNEHIDGLIEKSNLTYHKLIELLTRTLPETARD